MAHLLALPYYGPNNQITSVLTQLFLAQYLNMTAVIPRRIINHHVWNQTQPEIEYSQALRLDRYKNKGNTLTHSFEGKTLYVIGRNLLSESIGYFTRYKKKLDRFKIDHLVDYSHPKNRSSLLSQLKFYASNNKDVLYTDYGAALFQQMHPSSARKRATPEINEPPLQRKMQAFIKVITPTTTTPCDVGVHLRIFDTAKHIFLDTPLSNLTYALHHKKAKTTKTFRDLVGALRSNATFIKIMMPPALSRSTINRLQDAAFKFVQADSLIDAQKEIASCKLFVGDQISSVTTAVLRMRYASGLTHDSSISLKQFIFDNL